MDCPCYCHLHGCHVEPVDPGPCCHDMTEGLRPPNPPTILSTEPVLLSAASPKLYELKPGAQMGDDE